MLRWMARQTPGLTGKAGQRPPPLRGRSLGADRHPDVALHRLGAVIHVDRPPVRWWMEIHHPGGSLHLARRQAERLAEVARRPSRPVAREGGHQRRSLLAIALVDARDQLLADIAREVEVDVRRLGDLLVQEASQEQPVAHWVDVREPGQVADDGADARAASATWRQERSRRVGPPYLGGDLAGQLE